MDQQRRSRGLCGLFEAFKLAIGAVGVGNWSARGSRVDGEVVGVYKSTCLPDEIPGAPLSIRHTE